MLALTEICWEPYALLRTNLNSRVLLLRFLAWSESESLSSEQGQKIQTTLSRLTLSGLTILQSIHFCMRVSVSESPGRRLTTDILLLKYSLHSLVREVIRSVSPEKHGRQSSSLWHDNQAYKIIAQSICKWCYQFTNIVSFLVIVCFWENHFIWMNK